MSSKIKNISTRTVTQRTQGKSKRTTSDQKVDSTRNVKEKIDEKRPKNDTTKLSTPLPKEKEKTIAKESAIRHTRKPVVTKHRNISSEGSKTSQNERIVKTKYFPSKNNYAEMIQHINRFEVGSGDGNPRNKPPVRRRIPPPKQALSEEDSSVCDSTPERPKTSTLRKGSIVNENIAGPEAPTKQPLASPKEETKQDSHGAAEEAEYEDDFDSYESDFENMSSSDSTIQNISEISTESTSSSEEDTSSKATTSIEKDVEKKLDSGNFDLNESRRRQELSNLQELVEKDNARLTNRPASNLRSNFTSLSDEGFEEARSLQFLGFASAKKRHERRKSLEVRKKRGEELLNMIKLDCINFTIFDATPVPYEEFIKTYGNVNSMQVGVQTGEENVSEEIQTEPIETCEKWIQMPPHVSNQLSACYKHERLGVGPSLDQIPADEPQDVPQFNEQRLSRFLSNTGGLVMDILKERTWQKTKPKSRNPESSFSESVTFLKPPSEFLGRRNLSQVLWNPKNPSSFLSVHVEEDGDDYTRSMLYLWNVNDAIPETHMTCYGRVMSCSFGADSRSVIAGLHEGSLVVWDNTKNKIQPDDMYQMVEGDVVLKRPSFVTDVEKSHRCSVVAIRCVSEANSFDVFDKMESSWRVCSLDQDGTVLIWSVIARQHLDTTQSGVAYWGGIILMKNFEVVLRNMLPDLSELSCNDMFVSGEDSTSAFIGTNYGSILLCNLNKEKTRVKIHTSDIASPIKCLTPCPFSDTYFLGGQENGSIVLYSRKCTKPLMVLTNKNSENMDDSIEEIQWSLEKPCIFYTKNSRNVIDAWDLSKSNLFPVESLAFDGKISSMKLSPSKHEKSYVLISVENTIQVHALSQDHKKENNDQYYKEMKTFLTYVSRL